MKTFNILFLTLPLLCLSHPVDKSENRADTTIVVEDSDHAESESSQISKRSGGSFDIVNHLKTGLLSSVSRASASLASGSSGGSGGYKSIESSHNSVDFDPWTLKKSVLNTLFQAVKAITGGVTAIKGQLIKGSGYALSASGKLVAASGDKVTDVGKAIVHSAQLVPASPINPIAKFSSLSSLSSSHASKGSIPLSSSGPVTHSETITTYEIPSGHANYGPPSKPPSYSSPATHQYLPPGTYSGGVPFSGAVAFEGAPSFSYLPTKYGVPLVEGTDENPYYGTISTRDKKSAVKALKEIIHLLPTATAETKIQSAHYVDHKPVVEQYPIPTDPIPAIRIPLLGPVETISHTETITTAFGNSLSNKNKPTIIEEITIDNHGHPSPMYNPHAYDVYHTMTFKKNKNPSDQTPSASTLYSNNTKINSATTSTYHFDPRPQLKPYISLNTRPLPHKQNQKQNFYVTHSSRNNNFPTIKSPISKYYGQPFQIQSRSDQRHRTKCNRNRTKQN